MEYSTGLILIAIMQYMLFSAQVGMARGKYGVVAPSTTGHEIFERIYRVQINTLEQLIIYIPGMVAFGLFVSAVWVVIPGALFIIGRQVYAYAYVNNPSKRTLGMVIGFLSNVTLIAGSFAGVVMHIIG
ncbi:MAPEG family protein [Simiduia litorea]|uniref:MAPEG family protein n=1 Tax=Simiduia litorea TaxID=1435348 RepID=UPI0036F30CCA